MDKWILSSDNQNLQSACPMDQRSEKKFFALYTLSKLSWILFLLTIKIFKDDGNLLANVTFPYKTLMLVRFNREFKIVLYSRLERLDAYTGGLGP